MIYTQVWVSMLILAKQKFPIIKSKNINYKNYASYKYIGINISSQSEFGLDHREKDKWRVENAIMRFKIIVNE